MEWYQLEYFQTVAKLQHFTRAADVLSISQPALSRSIAKLENELGVPLFTRQGRSVQLNRYGKLFLTRVDRAMQNIAEGKEAIRGEIDPESGSVAISFLHTLGSHVIPELIGAFRQQYPAVDFQLFQNASELLYDQLEAGDVDLCLSSPPFERPHVTWEHLISEELYVIVPPGHTLAQQRRPAIHLKDIAAEPFINLKKGYGLRAIADRLCREAGFTPQVTFEGEEATTIVGLVAAGLGVSLMPDISDANKTKVYWLRVSEPRCRRMVGIAWAKQAYLSPAATRFRQFVIDYFREIQYNERDKGAD
ncbi:LysR family transcriptional regulator [Numidum massiliense]|uniref:LysR family transcriptional regulator n=1 Tax=Numidum massiliense TaxID=1522315 RepID=UPI0006D55DE1|nr:LysR family transcriptional regulator [Numidum massiliense]